MMDGSRVIDEHPTAGKKIQTEHQGHQQAFLDIDGDTSMEVEENPFFPFASELDWKIGNWAVKDGSGHNAFDHLLQIPEVSCLYIWIFFLLMQHIGHSETRTILPQYLQPSPEAR